MHLPSLLEGVRLVDAQGVFLVLVADYTRRCADLLPANGDKVRILENVPFARLVSIAPADFRARARAAQD